MDRARVSLAQLAEIRELVGHVYEALVLAILYEADGPMRWSELVREVNRRADEWIDGRLVTRALEALRDAGLVQVVGGQMHALTQSGRERAQRLAAIVIAADRHRGGTHRDPDSR